MELSNRIIAELIFWSKRRNYHFRMSCISFAFKYNFSSDKRTTNQISCLKLADQWTTLINITVTSDGASAKTLTNQITA